MKKGEREGDRETERQYQKVISSRQKTSSSGAKSHFSGPNLYFSLSLNSRRRFIKMLLEMTGKIKEIHCSLEEMTDLRGRKQSFYNSVYEV